MEDLKQFGCTVVLAIDFKEQCFNDLNAAKEMYDTHGVSVLNEPYKLFTDLLKANKVEVAKWIYSIREFNQQEINNALHIVCQSSGANIETCDYLFSLGATVNETVMNGVNQVSIAEWLMMHFNFNHERLRRTRLINLMIPKNYKMATWLLKTIYVGCEFTITDSTIIDAIETDNYEFVEICARQHGYTISHQVIAHVARSENYDKCEWMCNMFSIDPEEHGFSLYTGPKSALKTR